MFACFYMLYVKILDKFFFLKINKVTRNNSEDKQNCFVKIL